MVFEINVSFGQTGRPDSVCLVEATTIYWDSRIKSVVIRTADGLILGSKESQEAGEDFIRFASKAFKEKAAAVGGTRLPPFCVVADTDVLLRPLGPSYAGGVWSQGGSPHANVAE